MVGSKALLFLCALGAALVGGCSDLRLLSKSPDVVVSARTMDFKIDISIRWSKASLAAHYGWRTKYGFVGFNTMGINAAADGLNAKGLSAAYLVLADTKYPALNLTAGHLPIVSSFVTYILGNFATVDQVRDGLQQVYNSLNSTLRCKISLAQRRVSKKKASRSTCPSMMQLESPS
ncbi:hypothetical protein AC1031_013172 [Aphanomyces cochlioides]|nr:hypothetical protein AC1031_013172 [Aphanomyces cochlioides]